MCSTSFCSRAILTWRRCPRATTTWINSTIWLHVKAHESTTQSWRHLHCGVRNYLSTSSALVPGFSTVVGAYIDSFRPWDGGQTCLYMQKPNLLAHAKNLHCMFLKSSLREWCCNEITCNYIVSPPELSRFFAMTSAKQQ